MEKAVPEAVDHADHRLGRHGVAAVDRHHDHVEPADRGVLGGIGYLVQVAEIASAALSRLLEPVHGAPLAD